MKRILIVVIGMIVPLVGCSPELMHDCKVPSQYPTVAAAVRACKPNGVITIAAGEYEVSDLYLKEGITLSGAGRDTTILWTPAGDETFRVKGVRGVTLKDFRVESRGEADELWALVLVTKGGKLLAEKVYLAGGRNCLLVKTNAAVELRSCRLRDTRQSVVLIADGARVSVDDCDISGNKEYHGIAVKDKDSYLEMRNTQIHDNNEIGIYVSEGARAQVEDCDIFGSKNSQGVVVGGKDSHVDLRNTQIHDNKQSGLYIYEGAQASVDKCDISGSKEYGGVTVQEKNSYLEMRNTQIHDNRQDGLHIRDGARASVDECDIFGNKEYQGVAVKGTGSRVDLRNTQIHDNRRAGLYISEGARASVDDCDIYGSEESGVSLYYKDSYLEMRNTVIHDNNEIGIYVSMGARARVEDCDISGSKVLSGIMINGKDSHVDMRDMVIHDNKQSGIFLYEGASLRAIRNITAHNGLHGIAATGVGTRAEVEHSVIFGNRQIGAWAHSDAEIHIADSAIVENGFWGLSSSNPDGSETTGSLRLSHNLVSGNKRGNWDDGSLPGDHVQADPNFVAPDAYIFALSPDSPAKGAGRDGKDIGLYPEGRAMAVALPMPKTPRAVRKETAPSPKPGRNLAVVVGVELYTHESIPDLKYARDDGEDMARFLRNHGYQVTELTDANATLVDMREALTWLANESRPEDRVLFYFSGHGSDEADPLRRGRGYLLPVDARARSLAATALPLSELRAASDNAPAKRFTVLLDACFAGGAGSKSVKGRRLGMKALTDKSITGGTSFGPGKISLYSSRDNEPSFEAETYQNSYFTHHLLQAWESGLRTADEVYQYVYEKVSKDTKGEQHPRRDYDNAEGIAVLY